VCICVHIGSYGDCDTGNGYGDDNCYGDVVGDGNYSTGSTYTSRLAT